MGATGHIPHAKFWGHVVAAALLLDVCLGYRETLLAPRSLPDRQTNLLAVGDSMMTDGHYASIGNDEDGFFEALLGIDEEGRFPLRVRASEFEAAQINADNN